ncbi:bifunctional diguanylate cyclase/phosphodiesterase [Duganella radicis]|uniref:EAL domain-containing protein n=1 Tax=Duganella radicis TaxID=551988 RepID=A0A6L6PBN7_9BURK|nr:EAL domain-containing protein [Duganella radicis]MTV36253.1 EAL domain-containing protein [Duganella radicis]
MLSLAKQDDDEPRLSGIVASLSAAIWSVRLSDRRIFYLSPIAEVLLGEALRPAAIGTVWHRVVQREDRRPLLRWFYRVLDGHTPLIEIRIVRADGARRWLQLSGKVSRDADGRPVRVDGMATDVTERLTAESQVRKLSRVVEQSPAAVVITDVHGCIEYVNPRFCATSGYAEREVVGQMARFVGSGQTPQTVYATLWNTILAGGIWQGELLNRRKNGELYWEMEVIAPVFDARGRVCNFVAIKEDVTDKKLAEAELQRVNRTLRVLSRCNALLVRAASEEDLLESMCDMLSESGGYPMLWIAAPAGDGLATLARRGFAAAGDGCDDDWTGPALRALHGRRPVVERLADGARSPSLADSGVRAIASLPLLAGDAALGVLSLFSVNPQAFDAAELELLAELAADLAYGIVSQRGERARKARESDLHLMRRAIDASSDGIMVSDSRQDGAPLVYVNSAFERITGYAAHEALGRDALFLHAGDVGQDALAALRQALAEARPARAELRTCRRDGAPFWSELAIAPVLNAEGEVSHMVGVLTDISARKRMETQLIHQATHDALTGLPNRVLLADRVECAIVAARRAAGRVALMLFDLDRFKLVNDSLGHGAGDCLLRQIAERLTAHIRPGDTVARLGGDEFVVVAPVADERQAAQLAQELQSALAMPLQAGGQSIYPASSVGLAMFPHDGEDLTALLRNADAAMYRAKADGNSALCFYARDFTRGSSRRLQLESALCQALEAGQLLLHYQPKFSLEDGALAGAEVLLRWQHPTLGAVSPAEFIPIAEETGLILPIGAWVLRQSCRQLAGWQRRGLRMVPLAVNLSARQFALPTLAGDIRAMLREAGVGPRWLQLELTESLLVRQPEAASRTLEQLRAAGIQLALDDFGTGYSSLNYLRRFPITQLKIDQSFVRELLHDKDSSTIAVAIINLAHGLGMQVVAEGVETMAQLEFLRRHDCDQVQGYLSGRPQPAAQFERLLAGPQLPLALPRAAGADC